MGHDDFIFSEMLFNQMLRQVTLHNVNMYQMSRMLLSTTAMSPVSPGDLMPVVELARSGVVTEKQMSIENILQSAPKKIPLRDLRMLVRQSSTNVKKIPALLPRPSSKCYILDMEHIRILCFQDKVDFHLYHDIMNV